MNKVTNIEYSFYPPSGDYIDIMCSGQIDNIIYPVLITVRKELPESDKFDEIIKDKICRAITDNLAGEQ